MIEQLDELARRVPGAAALAPGAEIMTEPKRKTKAIKRRRSAGSFLEGYHSTPARREEAPAGLLEELARLVRTIHRFLEARR